MQTDGNYCSISCHFKRECGRYAQLKIQSATKQKFKAEMSATSIKMAAAHGQVDETHRTI